MKDDFFLIGCDTESRKYAQMFAMNHNQLLKKSLRLNEGQEYVRFMFFIHHISLCVTSSSSGVESTLPGISAAQQTNR